MMLSMWVLIAIGAVVLGVLVTGLVAVAYVLMRERDARARREE